VAGDYSRPVRVSPEERAFAASALVEGLGADAPIGFAVVSPDLRFELISDSLAAINGLPPGGHIGRTVAEILPPEMARPVEALMAEVRDTGTARTGVEVGGSTAAAPGEQRSFVAAYHPIEHEGRRLVGCSVVDVTDRRRAEAALRESERLLSDAQRMAGLGWWSWTVPRGTIVYGPELLELLGRDPGLAGTPHDSDRLGIDDAAERRRLLEEGRAALRERRPFATRLRPRRADGDVRLLAARGTLVHDEHGEPIGLQGFVQDITELDRAAARQRIAVELGQAALTGATLEELMQLAVEGLARGIGVDRAALLELGPDGTELTVRAAVEPEGYSGPRTVPVEEGGVPARALATGQPVVISDRRSDGRFAHSEAERAAGARSTAVVVIGGRARPFGLLGAMSARPGCFSHEDTTFMQALANVVADAVERRLAEAEIAELSAARGRLVAQAIDSEERARRRISETLHDEALQELLSAGLHLNALSVRPGGEEELRAAREGISRIVRELREVMSALHPTVLQYAGLAAAVHAVADQEGRAGGFDPVVRVQPEATGEHDGLLLSLARELLANAARHAGARRVAVAIDREGDDVVLDVTDDGAGLPEERLGRARAEGHIGLASCAERVEAVGGSLAIAPAPGGGTRIRATVPAADRVKPDRKSGISGITEAPDGE
jgi:PAS domain S-box-containing protein